MRKRGRLEERFTRRSEPIKWAGQVGGRVVVHTKTLLARIRWAKRLSERQGLCFWCLFSSARTIRRAKQLVLQEAPAFRHDPWLFVCGLHAAMQRDRAGERQAGTGAAKD